MKLQNEEMILTEEFRASVIEEIEGDENQKRKQSMKKRYDVFKDNTKKYVWEMMKEESEEQQVIDEIKNRTANISFLRKIIDKKAMVYKDGVKREIVGNEEDQLKIDVLVDLLNFNSQMKKANKYAELFKNAAVQVMPYQDKVTQKYAYKVNVLQPYLYDVIEDADNPEKPLVYIFSYYNPRLQDKEYAPPHKSGFREFEGKNTQSFRAGDGFDQTIADSPDDFGIENKEYVWWSHHYHFTTDSKGEIVSGKQGDDLRNPIGMLPFYNISQDQDGQFWAVGGEDIVDGSILLNVLLTDLYYIAKYQGMGIGYMFGKGVPKNMKVGASSFVSLEVEEGDPTPSIGFATSNPPIQAHLEMIEKYAAFLLSTNNLEPGTVQGQLSAAGAQSGIQEMVRRAENIDDIVDQQEAYKDGEPVIFELIRRWHNLYFEKGLLKDTLMSLGRLPEVLDLSIKFPQPQPFQTEAEKLDIIEKRMGLGLDSLVDAFLRDNMELTREEAEEKARLMFEEKLKESSQRLKMFEMESNDGEQGDVQDQT